MSISLCGREDLCNPNANSGKYNFRSPEASDNYYKQCFCKTSNDTDIKFLCDCQHCIQLTKQWSLFIQFKRSESSNSANLGLKKFYI